MYNTRRNEGLWRWVFYVFMSGVLLFPVSMLPKVVFAIIVAKLLMDLFLGVRREAFRTISPLICVAIGFYGYWRGAFGRIDDELAVQFLFAFALLFIFYYVELHGVDLDFSAKLSGLAICAVTWVLYLGIYVFQGTIIGDFAETLSHASAVAAGQRSFFAIEDMSLLHIGSAQFLFVPFAIYANKVFNNFSYADSLKLAFISITIFVTSSRGLFVVCLLAVIFIVLSSFNRRRLFFLFTGGVIVLPVLLDFLLAGNAFEATEGGNSIKIGHAESFFDHMSFSSYVFGEGLGAYYYSSGRNSLLAHTEITFLDWTRYVGLPLSTLLFCAVALPTLNTRKLLRDNGLPLFVFSMFLILSLTNPVLFNSGGMMAVLWYWKRVAGKPLEG